MTFKESSYFPTQLRYFKMFGPKSTTTNNFGNAQIDNRGGVIGSGSNSGYRVVNNITSDSSKTTDEVLANLYQIQHQLKQSTDLPEFEIESLQDYLDKAIKAHKRPNPDKERVQKSLKHMKSITDGIAAISSSIEIGKLIASTIAMFG